MATLLLQNALTGMPRKLWEQSVSLGEWLTGSWALLLSHPEDFAPAWMNTRGASSRLQAEFARRNAKPLSVTSDATHRDASWVAQFDDEDAHVCLCKRNHGADFGVIDLAERKIYTELESLPHPYVVVVDPSVRSRAAVTYREGMARDLGEVFRIVDLLQNCDGFAMRSQGVSSPRKTPELRLASK